MSDSRLFKILYHLIDKGRATAPELASKFEVSTRTIYRDVDALSSAGIPICAESGRKGGIYLMDNFVLDKTTLSDEEKEEIMTALQSVAAAGNSLETTLLTKMSALFKSGNSANCDYDWLEIDFSRWGNHPEDNSKFELLKKAVIEHREVKIVYHSSEEVSSERVIRPIKLYFKSKEWYLKAFCLEKQDFRMFKLNRISNPELQEETFEPIVYPKTPEESQVYHKVVLLFPKNMGYRVYDEFDEEQIEHKENGDLVVTTSMPIDAWLISYLLSFGAQVELLEPKYLQKILVKQARSICDKYN